MALGEIFRPKTEKHNFLELGGILQRKSVRPKRFSQKVQLFYILRFGRPDPQGQEIAKYGFFRPVWPRAALGTERNSGPKTEKCNFPELGALFWGEIHPPQKFLPKSAQLFYILCFRRPDPHRRQIAKYGGFGHFWPRAALRT